MRNCGKNLIPNYEFLTPNYIMRFLRFIFSRFFFCVTVIAALIVAIIFLCIYIHSLLPAAAAIALAYVISVIAATALLSGNSPAEFKCGWLVLIVALPIGGAVLYFLSCLSRRKKEGGQGALCPSSCTSYEYFTDGAAYLYRLITLISAARRRVYLEYYIVSKGHIWDLIREELFKALKRGVDVKIIYDGLGSALRAPTKDFKRLRRAGAEIKVFNKLLPLPLYRLNFRDHRKIAAIDCNAVFLGGVNIADEYAGLTFPHGFWKDGGALFFGDIAAVYSDLFLRSFGGKNCDCPQSPRIRENQPIPITPVTDEPEIHGSIYEDELAGAIYAAKERVLIFTPYLCMGDKLRDALYFAVRRGVAVKIIVPHIPDKKLTYAITRAYCEELCENGVEIFTYTPGFMHFKGTVCDDKAYLGSHNFDFRSMRLNYECGVFGGERLALDLSRDFDNCAALSEKFRSRRNTRFVRLSRALLRLFAPIV